MKKLTIFFIATSIFAQPNLAESHGIKKSGPVHETRRITYNLFKNHPYVTTLLGYLLVNYMIQEKKGYALTLNNQELHWSTIQDSLPTAAIITSVGLDMSYNGSYSIPGQLMGIITDLFDTYASSRNSEFIIKSFDWLFNTIKKLPRMID